MYHENYFHISDRDDVKECYFTFHVKGFKKGEEIKSYSGMSYINEDLEK